MTATTATRVVIRWDAPLALEQFAALSALAEDCGYRMAMLGSVLKHGSGADLDLLMRPLHGVEQRREAFLVRFGGKLVKKRWNQERGIDGCQVERGGRLYDFIFGEFWAEQVVRTWAKKSSKLES
jgi:hypothetical protein